MIKQTANIITGCRIFGSICMFFCSVFSPCFYVLYLLCGLSDIADGAAARKTSCSSKFGAKFDTVADIIFAAVSMIKILPVIHLSKWLWICIIFIAIIKIINITIGFVCRNKFISLHTAANKITGFLMFVLPLTFQFIDLRYSIPVVCVIALFSAIQEGYYVLTGQDIL